MRGKTEEKALRQRLSSGTLTRADVVRRLGELAFGRANDCVKLADRLQALEQLSALVQESSADFTDFLDALRGGEQ